MRSITRPACPNPQALRTNYKHPDNKKALEDASHGKCMYCESKVTHVYFGDVEHIKPKAVTKYPELKFDWGNLGFCCARCNNSKSDDYEDDCPIIDPYSENPAESLIAFGSILYPKTGSERGDLTIRTLDLNRIDLVEKRALRLDEVQNAVNACYRTANGSLRTMLLQELEKEGNLDREFSFFAGALVAANR
ncbi:HNH endonuclease [Pseudomonas putida]|uniref:HNH endonuclease n=1 Tax=Pseudomonas putida TaxID=303 RepID=UPI001F518A83|nr:HNH endonuclease [Pseudomonas putida]